MLRLLKMRIVHTLDEVWPFLHQALFEYHILFQWRYATSYKYTVWFNNNHRLWGVWKRAQSICSMKLLQVDQMELQEVMAMSITTVCMVPTRFAPLKNQWEAILMVHFLFFCCLILLIKSFQFLWTICASMWNQCTSFILFSKTVTSPQHPTKSILHLQSGN